VATLAAAAGPALAQSGYLDNQPEREIGGLAMQMGARLADFVGKVAAILVRAPLIPGDWATSIANTFAGGSRLAVMAVVIAVVMLFCGRIVRRLAESVSRRERPPLQRALLRLLDDGIGLVAAFALSLIATNMFLMEVRPDGQFAAALLSAAFLWSAARLAFGVFLRPDRPGIRLVLLDDASASAVLTRFSMAAAIMISFNELIYVFLAHELPLPSAQFSALCASSLSALIAASAVHRLGRSLQAHRRRVAVIGYVLLATLLGTWWAAVVTLDFAVFDAMRRTLLTAWAVLALNRLLELALRTHDDVVTEGQPPRLWKGRTIVPPIQRSLLAIAGMIVVLVLGRVWFVGILGLFSIDRWSEIAQALGLGLGILVVGYVAFEMLRALAKAHAQGPLSHTDAGEAHPISRLGTVLPILNIALLVICVMLAALVLLSNLGVNTAPLIAGAGIFGLAISFGSQALVRDIVSGIFYMADDAFRVGEYIESGRLKGTVERILVRSLRLRHQNGQVHTIPYGQLGSVTNYSRDWATLKFNLRLARDVDLELVRKTAKKVGQELLEDPEVGEEFLEPLKLQGVADILENAVVCRFKMTVRPLKPSQVQREAIKRLYQSFREKGIAFAAYQVTVQGEQSNAAQAAAAQQLAALTSAAANGEAAAAP